jgi:hypothetical protein
MIRLCYKFNSCSFEYVYVNIENLLVIFPGNFCTNNFNSSNSNCLYVETVYAGNQHFQIHPRYVLCLDEEIKNKYLKM